MGDFALESPLQYSQHVIGSGQAVFDAMAAGGFEGVIAKGLGAPYSAGNRSLSWLKVKCIKRQEFVVIGWRPPDYGPDDVRGLFLATYENGKLVYRGSVGTGFTDKMRRDTLATLSLIRGEPLDVSGHAPQGSSRNPLGAAAAAGRSGLHRDHPGRAVAASVVQRAA